MASQLSRFRDLSPKRPPGRFCAIDFDSRQLRVVQAERSGDRTRIVKLASADMPPDLDAANPEAVGAFLGETLSQMHLKNAVVLMNVPRGQAVLKPITLPRVATTGEMANMVQYQAEKELTFRLEEAVIDFTIESHYGAEHSTPAEEQGEHVLVAAVKRPVVEYYQRIADAAKVRLLRLGLRPYANLRCIDAYGGQPAQARLAVVHITADEAEIDVVDEGGLTFCRSAVVKVPPPSSPDKAATAAAVQTVVAEVARSLQSYMAVERSQRIDSVLLAGATGIETQVATILAQRLNIPCEMLDPSRALNLGDAGRGTSAFISALGLAAGQGDPAGLAFDFLNPKRAPVQRDTKRLVRIAVAASVAVAALAVFGGAAYYLYKASDEVDTLNQRLSDLTTKNKKVAALAKRVDTINGWVNGNRDWLDQWAVFSAVFPTCVDTYITSLKTNLDGSVSFTVRAKTNAAINELGKRLADAGYEFRPGQVTTAADPYGYTYSTSVKVVVGPDKPDLDSLALDPRPADDMSAEVFGRPGAGRAFGGGGGGGGGGRGGGPSVEAVRPVPVPTDASRGGSGRSSPITPAAPVRPTATPTVAPAPAATINPWRTTRDVAPAPPPRGPQPNNPRDFRGGR